jgi:hypothetical protein
LVEQQQKAGKNGAMRENNQKETRLFAEKANRNFAKYLAKKFRLWYNAVMWPLRAERFCTGGRKGNVQP